ncbi:arsenite inducuble RNA associated protein aip-1 [Hyaloraphidium curvatum]|nr:arsenite inducuble RNA associated protein aip-1 [Hyaloraphidium curvatum]
MELPHVGLNCANAACRQIDFLPFTCQYCEQKFCSEHWKLSGHSCPKKHLAEEGDVRVPICPLCLKPVPVARGEDPNLRVDDHISKGCTNPGTSVSSAPAAKACSFPSCKEKSLVPIVCGRCRRNYCVKHRLERDHACPAARTPSPGAGKPNPAQSKAAAAAQSRAAAQADRERQMREDAELAAALQRSMDEQARGSGTAAAAAGGGGGRKKDGCSVS